MKNSVEIWEKREEGKRIWEMSGKIMKLVKIYFGLVGFLCLMAYQPSLRISFKSPLYRKTVEVQFNRWPAKYEVHTISFQTFFVWAHLLIVLIWNSSPLRSNLLRLQCTCFTVPTTSGRPHGSPLVWACQWPSSQPLSSPQLSHNDNLWA